MVGLGVVAGSACHERTGAVLGGTALACLSIAVLGIMLPLLARGSAGYPLGLGLGSTAGALVTPAVVTTSSWQVGLGLWALAALLAQQIWRRTQAELVVPRAVARSGRAGALTVHFGLISTVTFLVRTGDAVRRNGEALRRWRTRTMPYVPGVAMLRTTRSPCPPMTP